MEKLPELLWSSQVAGELTPKAAELTGLPPGVPVVTGTIDAASEALGAGVEKTGDMMMMYGSSNFFILKTETPQAGPFILGVKFSGARRLRSNRRHVHRGEYV